MKRNALYALLFLFLGAALAEWLSTPDAHAQALPPSSGGTSYTHPSAISLSNGINSSDGGTFASYSGTSFSSPDDTGNGKAIVVQTADKLCLNTTCTTYLVTELAGTRAIVTAASANVMDCDGTTGSCTFGYDIKATRATGDAITAQSGGYTRVTKSGAGAPTGTDCDAAGEAMRTYYDTTNHFHYVCEGAAGWYKSGVYAP